MKIMQSLLAFISLLALCQIYFGAAGLDVLYESQASNIGAQFAIQEGYLQRAYPGAQSDLWVNVQRWHQRTIKVTRVWCFVSGVALLVGAIFASGWLQRIANPSTMRPPQ